MFRRDRFPCFNLKNDTGLDAQVGKVFAYDLALKSNRDR